MATDTPDPQTPALAEQLDFQSRVQHWMMACFGPEISADKIERNHRFIEEALELVQANGCTRDEAHQLVDYVFDRPVGEVAQETGGVMVTLAALCLANGTSMHECGEVELARVWQKIETIRAKQAAKPKHSPLPQSAARLRELEPRKCFECDSELTVVCLKCNPELEAVSEDAVTAAIDVFRKSDCAPRPPVTEADMAAFGASHVACYKYPDDTPEHKAARAAFCDGAAWAAPRPPVAESGWREIEFEVSPPLNAKTLLGWYEPTGEWNCIVGQSSFGWRDKTANNVSHHSRAKYWQPLPSPPETPNDRP